MMRTLGFFIVAFLAAGCSEPANEKQHLRANLSTEPPSLNPYLEHDNISHLVVSALFDALVRVNPEGDLVPSIAERYTVSENKQVYTFYLRDSFWNNGSPLTAEDFAYTLKTILSPNSISPSASTYYVIKNAQEVQKGLLPIEDLGVSVVDSKTLKITLKHPAPYFLDIVSNLYPVSKTLIETDPDWHHHAGDRFVSNGPFLLKNWQHHSLIELIKNPTYWDADQVRLEKVTLTMVAEPSTQLAMFDEKELDWAGPPFGSPLLIDALPTLEKEGRLNTDLILASYFYLLNTKHPLLANKKIRKALAYAIDREKLTSLLLKGEQLPLTSIVPKDLSTKTAPLFPDGDSEKARELLKEGLSELGMTLKELSPITIIYNTDLGHHLVAQYVQEIWNRELGIRCSLQNMEWKVFLDRLNHCDFEIARSGTIADFRDPVTFLDLMRFDNPYLECTNFNSPEFLVVMEKIDKETNIEKRQQLVIEAEKILAEEMPLIPIYNHTQSYLKNPNLKQVGLKGTQRGDIKWAYFE